MDSCCESEEIMENNLSDNIIGGMFGLESLLGLKNEPPTFLTDNCVFLVNARSCISLIIGSLSPERIWLPSYLCGDVLHAILDPSKIEYYEVNADLIIKDNYWIDNLSDNDLVLVINYFGFKTDQLTLQRIKEKKAWIIEDACQSLLTADLGQYSDFVIFSPRKFIGIPDGGIICMPSNYKIAADHLLDPPDEWWRKSIEASVLRRIFDNCGETREWFPLFQIAENECPVGMYKMSDLSRTILHNAVDYDEISKARRRNYRFLLDSIGEYALYNELPSDVVPLGFPIRISNRNKMKEIFYRHNIYPPIHWDIINVVPSIYEESHKLSSMILTLICDQRYDLDHMQKIVDIVNRYAKK